MSELANKECVPCRGGVPPLDGEAIKSLLDQLGGGWKSVDDHHLEKEYSFKNFREAMAFTVKVGELAEVGGHAARFPARRVKDGSSAHP